MSNDLKIRAAEDGRVVVIVHRSCAISKEAILALLAEAGIDVAAVVFLFPEDVANFEGLNEVPVLIPIDQASCNAPELDTAGRQCGQAGGRVVIVFGEGFSFAGLHPVAEKYGTQCGWSASQLNVCINSPDLAPVSSGGSPVPRPKPEQVKC